MTEPNVEIRGRRDLVRGLPMYSRYALEHAPEGRLAVVLVHGLVISSAFMVPAMRELASWHPTHAPDLPGYGRSAKPPQQYSLERQADCLGAWMDTLGIEKAALVGCSLGTQIVSHLAVRRPELVDCAVLLSPTMDPAARSQVVSLARWVRELPYEISMLPIMLRDYARAGIWRAMRSFEIALADEPERRLPQMTMPTLVLRGELDPIVSVEWAEAVRDLLPAGQLKIVEQQSHALNFTAPVFFARTIADFVGAPALELSRAAAHA